MLNHFSWHTNFEHTRWFKIDILSSYRCTPLVIHTSQLNTHTLSISQMIEGTPWWSGGGLIERPKRLVLRSFSGHLICLPADPWYVYLVTDIYTYWSIHISPGDILSLLRSSICVPTDPWYVYHVTDIYTYWSIHIPPGWYLYLP